MRVFLGLGKSQLPPAGGRHNLAKRFVYCLRCKQCVHFRIQRFGIGGHTNHG